MLCYMEHRDAAAFLCTVLRVKTLRCDFLLNGCLYFGRHGFCIQCDEALLHILFHIAAIARLLQLLVQCAQSAPFHPEFNGDVISHSAFPP